MAIKTKITKSTTNTTTEEHYDNATADSHVEESNTSANPFEKVEFTRKIETGSSVGSSEENKLESSKRGIIGKTFADLISEQLNNPKHGHMIMLFFIVAFFICPLKDLSFKSFMYSLFIGSSFTVIWGIIIFFGWLTKIYFQ